MAVIIKNISGREYAYLVTRQDKRVVHKYLGSTSDPRVAKLMSDRKKTGTVPEQFRSLFWDTTLGNIHIRRNARYIIERVLEFGDMDAVNWLQRNYSVQAIVDVLLLSKGISKKTRNFWMLWFGVSDV
ncbi:MAG TPA: hypothetical protein VN328_11635 [Thermodesulfovibrionales bacterium]|nr:hypothetical protein [Thermodesulfovibrionales bacterium]